MCALVEEAVTVGDPVRLLSFRGGHANLVEMTLARIQPARWACGSPTCARPATRCWSRSSGTAPRGLPERDAVEASDELLFVVDPEFEAERWRTTCPPRTGHRRRLSRTGGGAFPVVEIPAFAGSQTEAAGRACPRLPVASNPGVVARSLRPAPSPGPRVSRPFVPAPVVPEPRRRRAHLDPALRHPGERRISPSRPPGPSRDGISAAGSRGCTSGGGRPPRTPVRSPRVRARR